jgi:long-subunit acyl-CoA synthetase (AMP-forming)
MTQAMAAQDAATAIDQALRQDTLCAAFQVNAAANASRPALREFGEPGVVTWREYADRVRSVAGGLSALGIGVGEPVGLMMGNRPEFHFVDTAALHLGALPFSIYHTNPPEQVRPLVENSGTRIIVTEAAYAPTVARVAEEMKQIEHVVVVDGDAGEGMMTLAELEALDAPDLDFEGTWRAVGPDTLATIVYTSGTTGAPKGVEWSHGAFMKVARAVHTQAPVSPEGRWVAYLPMAHLAERFCGHYGSLIFGYSLTCLADHKQLPAAVAEVRPTRFFGVPRIYEKLMAHARAVADSDEELRAALERALAGEDGGSGLAALRERLGLDALEYPQSSAAPAREDILRFFGALGLRLVETWGMSETATSLANPPDAPRIGTVGTTLPGTEASLADDGELLIRGPIFSGYRNDPEKTREAFDADGWLHTGDVAAQVDDGYYKIVDRKKEIIINSAGKNIAPAMVENRVKQFSPIIGTAVAIGDARLYVTALIVLDEEGLDAFAADNGLTGSFQELAESEAVRSEVARAVADANATLARVEQIKTFRILDRPWTPGGDEITSTMKLRRRVINDKYREEIEALYG